VDELAYLDLDAEEASLLPRRETLLTIVLPTINVAAVAALNLGFAVNAYSIGAVATAIVSQAVTISQ
jgi:hypothetical protein